MRTINLIYTKVFVCVLLLMSFFSSCSSQIDKVVRQHKSEGCVVVDKGESYVFYYNDSALYYENLVGTIVPVIDFTKEYGMINLYPVIGDSVSIKEESYINGYYIVPSKCRFKAIQDWGILVTEFESDFSSKRSRLFLVSKPQNAYFFNIKAWQNGDIQIKKDYVCLTEHSKILKYGQWGQLDTYYYGDFPKNIVEPELEEQWNKYQKEDFRLLRYSITMHLLPNGQFNLKDYCEVHFPYMYQTYSYSDILEHKEIYDFKRKMLKMQNLLYE